MATGKNWKKELRTCQFKTEIQSLAHKHEIRRELLLIDSLTVYRFAIIQLLAQIDLANVLNG